MTQQFIMVDREGTFKATIIENGIKAFDSGAVAFTFSVRLTALWDSAAEKWWPWEQYNQGCDGDIWLVNKQQKLLDLNVKSLAKALNWNGDFTVLGTPNAQFPDVQVVIKNDEYKDKTRLRVQFLNPVNSTPGGMGLADDTAINALKARFGGQIRAIVSVVEAATAPIVGPGPQPPAPPAPPAPPGGAVPPPQNIGPDGLPF